VTRTETQPPARFDVGRVISRSFAVGRERWLTLTLLILGVGFTPILIARSVAEPKHHVAAHDLGGLAVNGAWSLGPALLQHFALAAVVRASVGPKEEAGFIATVRSVLIASPILFPAWLASEYDTFFSLWNDWTQTFRLPPGLWARLVFLFGGLGLDIAVAAVAVAAVGVFTPVALSEHGDIRRSLIRSWRLMSGGRRGVVALYLVLFVVVVIISAVGGIAAIWLRSGGTPNAVVGWTVRALSTVVIDFWGVLVAVSYLDLRRLHDGALPDQLAEVFA
jgi:hypothetical protein